MADCSTLSLLQVEEKVQGIIRKDSVASIENEGVVGDKFVLIKKGSARTEEVQACATLPSKEPFDLALLMLLAGSAEPENRLAGKSALNRLELAGEAGAEDRYKKVHYEAVTIDKLLVNIFVEAHAEPPQEIVTNAGCLGLRAAERETAGSASNCNRACRRNPQTASRRR